MMLDDYRLFFVLLCHRSDESIIITREKRLPTITYEESLGKDIDKLCGTVKEQLCTPFDIRFLREECEEQRKRRGGFSAFEYRPALLVFVVDQDKRLLSETRDLIWIPRERSDRTEVYPPAPSVTCYLRMYRVDGLHVNSDRLKPHSRVGFFEQATAWVQHELQKKLSERVKSVTQIASQPWFVMRISCESGVTFYMKGVTPKEGNDEVITTVALGKVMPNDFKKPVSSDLTRSWLLLCDLGETMPWEEIAESVTKSKQQRKKILRDWASIQKKSIHQVNRLLSCGVPLWDGAQMIRQAKEMIKDPLWFQAQKEALGSNQELIPNEREYKEKFLMRLEVVINSLSGHKVPLALVHGDLDPVNTVWSSRKPCKFLDFEATCISYPFLDVTSFMSISDLEESDVDFHLDFWLEYEPKHQLRELLETVQEVEDLVGFHFRYQQYYDSEECYRLSSYNELASNVASE